MNSIAAFFSSSLARADTAKCTLVPSVTCCDGPLGTMASPKSMPADLKPVVIQGPTTSIAAFFDWNSLSASAPPRPTGEIFLFRIRSDQYCTALTVLGFVSMAFWPSGETTSPPPPQIRIGHIGMVSWSASARPYCSGLPSPFLSLVSFCAYEAHCAHVVGGLLGFSPAALNMPVFQYRSSVVKFIGMPYCLPSH